MAVVVHHKVVGGFAQLYIVTHIKNSLGVVGNAAVIRTIRIDLFLDDKQAVVNDLCIGVPKQVEVIFNTK